MCRTGVLLTLVAMLTPTTAALPEDGAQDESSSTPAYKRLLTGADVDQAAEWNRQIDEAQAADDYARAIEVAGELLKLRIRAQGADHYQTVSATHSLAALKKVAELTAERRQEWHAAIADDKATEKLVSRAQYELALPPRRRMLELRRAVLGEDHPHTAESYNNVAVGLQNLGKLVEAEALHRKALDIRRQLLPEDHPAVAQSYNNVGYVLAVQGKSAQAAVFYQKALEIRQRVLGEDHTVTAESYNNLGVNFLEREKPADAEKLLRKALAIRLELLGENHADTARVYDNLAASLDRQGKASEAEPFIRKALEIRRRVLSENHPDTGLSYNSLAATLNKQGKAAEAEPLFRKALEISVHLVGEDHSRTAVCYSNLAKNLEDQRKWVEAEALRRKAIEVFQRVLREVHSDTAMSYYRLAKNLEAQGRPAEANPHYRKTLEIRRSILGDDAPYTAQSYRDLARSFVDLGNFAEAEPFVRKALEICVRLHGEEHSQTAESYSSLAYVLNARGKAADAEPLFRAALRIDRQLLGEGHVNIGGRYNNLAMNLNAQGRLAEAEPLLRKALEINWRVLGEDHLHTVGSLSNLAHNMEAQGKAAEAEVLLRKALEISQRVLSEGHPQTAIIYNNLAYNVDAQGKAAEAEPLFRKALEIQRRVLGDNHPNTATSYNNVAGNLSVQGKVAEAEPIYRQALEIRQRVLGEDHPDIAQSYNNVARNMEARGRATEAESLLRKALQICRRVQGEDHPDTARGYISLAWNLLAQGKAAEAKQLLPSAIYSYEASRLTGAQGVERALLNRLNPRLLLAEILHVSEPVGAWREIELSLARGLLDQGVADFSLLTPGEQAVLGAAREQIAVRQPRIGELVARSSRTDEENRLLAELIAERREAQSRIADLAVAASTRAVADEGAIQGALLADEAILLWVDVRGKFEEHLACIIRGSGDPRWKKLPGSGTEGAWSKADSELARQFTTALAGRGARAEIDDLAKRLHYQRIEPVLEHLKGVTKLYVVPAYAMAGVPVEALTSQFKISYVPSGTFLARIQNRPKPSGNRLLAVGDPLFRRPNANKNETPIPDADDLPPSGLLVIQVVPGGTAAQSGLRVGDVLVSYAGVEVNSIERLAEVIQANAGKEVAAIGIWREGVKQPLVQSVRTGKLGATLAKEPAREVIANRRKTDAMLLALRGGSWKELPGTRVEVRHIARLLGDQSHVLLDSEASEQSLEALRASGELAQFRYLHFATHGEANQVKAFESVVVLSQDSLDEDLASEPGKPFVNGKLSAREVLEYWKLDADLVTLSACETAVGKVGGGDGQLGFAQAFLTAGARSVLLSLWKVDDSATALLMSRFYENLLGNRAGLSGPMSKSMALDEAKRWLRDLPADEALQLMAVATEGIVRDNRGKDEDLKLVVPSVAPSRALQKSDKPFADPRYWAAFILIGEP